MQPADMATDKDPRREAPDLDQQRSDDDDWEKVRFPPDEEAVSVDPLGGHVGEKAG
jgi:hypothetical protein